LVLAGLPVVKMAKQPAGRALPGEGAPAGQHQRQEERPVRQGRGWRLFPEVQAALCSDPALASETAARLLENHFPESIHADILAAVNLTLGVDEAAAKKRDPRFRQRVLTAYEYRCAVCGFVRLGPVSIALDAVRPRRLYRQPRRRAARVRPGPRH
jgi:hypothetical protein